MAVTLVGLEPTIPVFKADTYTTSSLLPIHIVCTFTLISLPETLEAL
jgi:hypothetical protein